MEWGYQPVVGSRQGDILGAAALIETRRGRGVTQDGGTEIDRKGLKKEICEEILVCVNLLGVKGRRERALSKMNWTIHSPLT